MEVSRREIEVKLPYASVDAARAALERLDVVVERPRHFEDNLLFDRDGKLKKTGRLLRLRRVGDEAWVTYKARPAKPDGRHKVRLEEETPVTDAGAMRRILEGVGFELAYRYQKFRTEMRLDDLHICLDETPIGCFVELEGEPDAIDRTAARLGFVPATYVTASYRELHDFALADGSFHDRNMIFDGSTEAAD